MRLELAASVLLAVGQFGYIPLNIQRDMLLANDKGYLLGVDRCIAGPGELRQWSWSSDGQALAVITESRSDADRIKALKGEQIPPEATLTVYDVAKNSTVTLKGVRGESMPMVHGWLPGSRALLYSVLKVLPSGPQRDEPEMTWSLYRWTPGGGSPQVVFTGKQPQEVAASSKRPYALLVNYQEPVSVGQPPTTTTYMIGLTGQAVPLKLPEDTGRGDFAIDREGTFYFTSYVFGPPTTGARRTITETAYRLGTDGKVDKVPTVPQDVESAFREVKRSTPNPNGLQILQTVTEAKHASEGTKLMTFWMWMPEKGKVKATLIAPEAIKAELSPSNSAVAYATRDNVFIRRIDTVNRVDLEAMLENEERKQLMNNAKQVAVAMMIYGADSDDLLPPSTDWQNRLMPYLKSGKTMDGFQYEMNGEDLSKVSDPAKKRMGSVDGRYGRAIVFADGHVVWEKRRQP